MSELFTYLDDKKYNYLVITHNKQPFKARCYQQC